MPIISPPKSSVLNKLPQQNAVLIVSSFLYKCVAVQCTSIFCIHLSEHCWCEYILYLFHSFKQSCPGSKSIETGLSNFEYDYMPSHTLIMCNLKPFSVYFEFAAFPNESSNSRSTWFDHYYSMIQMSIIQMIMRKQALRKLPTWFPSAYIFRAFLLSSFSFAHNCKPEFCLSQRRH